MNRTSLRIARPAPRNPFVAAARKRHAGRHGAGRPAERQKSERALRVELDRMRHPNP